MDYALCSISTSLVRDFQKNLTKRISLDESYLGQLRLYITKDIELFEKLGLLVSHKRSNPGHGVKKLVKTIAPKIEMIATLG